MNKEINIGTFVEALDEDFKGKVVKLMGDEAVILTNDGFELMYPIKQLILIGDDSIIKQGSSYGAIESAKTQKVTVNHHKVNTEKISKN